MTEINLLVPIRIPSSHGFYSVAASPMFFRGHELRLRVGQPYCHLVVKAVQQAEANATLENLRNSLAWAAVRLDMSLQTPGGEISKQTGPVIDGTVPTAFPGLVIPNLVMGEVTLKTDQADANLFHCLGFPIGSPGPELTLALEIFSTVDFETSDNAKFLALTSIVEILASPKARPKICADIIDDAVRQLDQAMSSAQGDDVDALSDMRQAAIYWKKESIRSSVRRLAKEAADATGRVDPEGVGKEAAKLYDMRSSLAHGGKPVDRTHLLALRRSVREIILFQGK